MEIKNIGKNLIKLVMTATLLTATFNSFAADTISVEQTPIPTIDKQNEEQSEENKPDSQDKEFILMISENDESSANDETKDSESKERSVTLIISQEDTSSESDESNDGESKENS